MPLRTSSGHPSHVDCSPLSLVRKGDAARSEAKRHFGSLPCFSPAMQRVFALLGRLSPTEVTLTLVGETGTGKDVLANAVHSASPRANGPFVVFDCGAVAQNLAESELFGHERGSFTGALSAHTGAFERAHGGTLFLDEIGELPLDLQPRLLRALESRRVRRVGGGQDRAVDVRVVAATNRDLPAEVASNRFRQDLFFRLAGAVVPVPSLRERASDLPLLVPDLLRDLGHPDIEVTPAVFDMLARYPWPGNVRELKNTLACAIAFVDGGTLDRHHVQLSPIDQDSLLQRLPLGGQSLDNIERVAIKQTLAQMGGNKSHTARALGIAVSTLYQKLKRHGI